MPSAKKITRKELRQPDEFVFFARRALTLLQSHERFALFSGLFAGGMLLFILGWQWYWAFTSARASHEFQQALSTYRASAYQRAADQFSQVASHWPRTTSGRLASLYLGHCYVQQRSYAKAIEVYRDFLDKASKDEYLYQLALLSLAQASEREDSNTEALSFYSQAASLSGLFTGEALLGQARLYEKLDDSAKAVEAYQEFLSRYPESPLGAMIEAKAAAVTTVFSMSDK